MERFILLTLVLLALLAGACAFIGGASFEGELTPATSEAAPPTLEVPNLVGAFSVEEARGRAGEDFIVEGVLVESGETVGAVVGQDPEPGTAADKGTVVRANVSGR